MALGRSGLDNPEKRAQAADAWRHWLASGPKDDPQRPAIEREVERLTHP
jgi:cytochrome c-type biogenesis protein CcmH/NrfG